MVSEVWGSLCEKDSLPCPTTGDRWHLDEVFLRINGEIQNLWRAVDQDGEVLDILVQPRRNKQAAKKFFRKLLKGLQYAPRVIVTDKLGSYSSAKRDVDRLTLTDTMALHFKLFFLLFCEPLLLEVGGRLVVDF